MVLFELCDNVRHSSVNSTLPFLTTQSSSHVKLSTKACLDKYYMIPYTSFQFMISTGQLCILVLSVVSLLLHFAVSVVAQVVIIYFNT